MIFLLPAKTIPLVKKAHARKIPMQIHVHIAYADIYHFKAAIERAKGTSDIKTLIKAMEDVETVYSLGKVKYETQKIKPFYHSRVRVDPNKSVENLSRLLLSVDRPVPGRRQDCLSA